MELAKKTTILFSDAEHARLSALAARRGVSLGWLVREACAAQYAVLDQATRMAAVDALVKLTLPVGTPSEMKEQSVPAVGELMP